ncbi:MAG: 3'(2'),5'-bisphosphate nucleotidase CysQ [Pseudomonadota bacterium]
MTQTDNLLPEIIAIARDAGKIIMNYYKTGIDVVKKSDASPVTEADKAADLYIVDKIKNLTPDYAIVSEEGNKPNVRNFDYFWLIDPLDGTKSFIRGSGYFTVNIALIDAARKPILGVIYEPISESMYYGSPNGAFLEQNGITKKIKVSNYIIASSALVSHSHLDHTTQEYLEKYNIEQKLSHASSIKLCFLAEGKADIYPRFGRTMEWDIAAGHAILNAAGGTILTPEDAQFVYGKETFQNGNFIAYGKKIL